MEGRCLPAVGEVMADVFDPSVVGTPVSLSVPELGTPPPSNMVPSIIEDMAAAVARAGLQPNQLALVGSASKRGGFHGGVIGTIPGGVQVHIWVGRHWQPGIDWGVQVVKVITIGGK